MPRARFIVSLIFIAFQLPAYDNPAKGEEHGTSSAGIREDLSTLAGNMLDETNHARTAIKNGNLELAQKHVNRAEADLHTADAALADVQEGVQIRSDKADMPLEEARENLILARASIRNGNYQEAQSALRAASQALSMFANEGGPHANEARAIEEEINTYNQNLQQNNADAMAKINKWWNTTADWSTYRMGAAR